MSKSVEGEISSTGLPNVAVMDIDEDVVIEISSDSASSADETFNVVHSPLAPDVSSIQLIFFLDA